MRAGRRLATIALLGLACASATAWSEGERTDRPEVAAWLDVVDGDGPFVLLADSRRGSEQRRALLDAARKRNIPLVLPGSRDAFLLGHVATETAVGHAQLRHFAGNRTFLIGTLTLQPDGHWNASWRLELPPGRGAGSQTSRTATVQRTSLGGAMDTGIDLAVAVPERP